LPKKCPIAAGTQSGDAGRELEAARLFLTADGEKDKAWGNETIRWNPGEGWLEIRLPAPLAHLANRPRSRYRLPAPVGFSYRGSEVAAQAATGAVRYDISCDPVRGRWYLDRPYVIFYSGVAGADLGFCCLIGPGGDLRSWLRWLR